MPTNRIDTEPNFIYPDPDIIRSKLNWDDVDLLENLVSRITASFEFLIDDFRNPFVQYVAPIIPQFTFNVITGLNKTQVSDNELLTSFEFSIATGDDILETYTKSVTPNFTFTVATGTDGSSSTTHDINTSFTFDITQQTQENFLSSSQKNVNTSFTYSASQSVCPVAGTVLNTYCVGFDLYETRADGNCGTTEVLVAVNSTTCGYTPPPPPPPKTANPTINIVSTTENSVTFNITNNDASTATVNWGLAPPLSGSVPLNSGGNTGNITISGLLSGKNYSVLATAEASGKTISDEVFEPFTTDSPPQLPVPSSPTNVTFDILDNHCNYHYVSLTNPNNFTVTVEVRRSGQTWQTLNTVGANHTGLVFPAVADTGSGPFGNRTYEVRFTSAGGTSSAVSYTISYTSCSTNTSLIPADAVYV